MNSLANTRYTSLALKVVGIILIISALVDFITLSIPIKLSESAWQLQFTNSVVDRGIVPMLGIILLLIGYWVDSTQEQSNKKKKSFDLRLLIFSLAVLFGLCYLILIPIHLTNVGEAKRIALIRINQQAQQSETQIQEQYNQLQQLISDSQSPQKIQEGLKQIDAVLGSGQQLSAQQRVQLEQNKQRLQTYQSYLEKPELLDTELVRLQTQLDDSKLKKVTQANLESLKQSVRISISSFLLAIGYSILGWFGLKTLITAKTKSRTSIQ